MNPETAVEDATQSVSKLQEKKYILYQTGKGKKTRARLTLNRNWLVDDIHSGPHDPLRASPPLLLWSYH